MTRILSTISFIVAASALLPGICAAQPDATAPMSDKQRIDSLIRQNQLLIEENAKLKAQAGRPRTKEESFAACMQAAKGQTSAMAAESIGGHCDQLLKK